MLLAALTQEKGPGYFIVSIVLSWEKLDFDLGECCINHYMTTINIQYTV